MRADVPDTRGVGYLQDAKYAKYTRVDATQQSAGPVRRGPKEYVEHASAGLGRARVRIHREAARAGWAGHSAHEYSA
eukprot:5413143-Prymnesium_polylepis.1